MNPGIKRAVGGCLGKCAYDNEDMAHAVKRQREKVTGKRLRVYHCDLAPHWHLSSTPPTGFAKVDPRCAVCMELFEPTGPDDWACVKCRGAA